jgi:putative two-component system response regulator
MNWRGDLEATRKDGTEFEAYVSAGMVRGQGWQPLCMMATFVDVTKEKESERELVRVRAALDGATDAIVMVDKDGKPVYANDAYRSIIGQSLAALESQGLASVYANTAEAERMLQTLQREGSWCGEIDLRTPAGGRLPMLLRGDSIRDGRGEVVGYMLVHTDIVERKIMEQQLSRRNRLLEDQVRQRTAELERARLDMVWRLARAGELRDECTGNHVVRVGFYCRLAGERLGLDADLLERIFITSPLHDIGKIGIPDGILLKPEALTPRERQTIESHCELGADILARDVMGNQSLLQAYSELNPLTRTPGYHALLATAAEIARNHHERWDGDGYPRGLASEDIPISARIASVADVYDALVTERPYKEAFSHEEALAIIGEGRGTQFDPDVVDAFLAVGEEVYSVLRDLHD